MSAPETRTPPGQEAAPIPEHDVRILAPARDGVEWNAVPAELKERPQWVRYKLEMRKGKQAKIPCCPSRSANARTDDPSTWSTFDKCMANVGKNGTVGVGYVFTEDDPDFGVDLDKCVDENGKVSDVAAQIVTRFGTYAEVSPSGTGIKLFGRGRIPPELLPAGQTGYKVTLSDRGFEIYHSRRFFTVTARHVPGTPTSCAECGSSIPWFIETFIFPNQKGKATKGRAVAAVPVETAAGHICPTPLAERRTRAIAYLAKCGPAIEGQDGSGVALRTAVHAVRGFCLPEAEALQALAGWNSTCVPPWDDPDLLRKVREAARIGDMEWHHHLAEVAETDVSYFITHNTVADRFATYHANQLRYVDTWKRWFTWKRGRWENDEALAVHTLARKLSKRILIEAAENGSKEALKSGVEFQKRSSVEAVVALSRCDPLIARRPIDFDAAPWLFNVSNGTVNLETGALRPARQEDHLTKASPVRYDSKAECPRWERFLEEIFLDPDVRSYIKRAVGYSLTASTREQVLFFAHGTGSNGKSVFLETISYIVGDYAKTAPPELLVAKQGDEKHPAELAALAGVRLVSTVETESGRRLAESRTKFLTGSDRICARFLYGDFFEFEPTFKLWLISNHKPVIRGTDWAIWRRFHMIPFTVVFPPDQRDTGLLARLRAEAPGILRWMIEGCLEWQRNGLCPPKAVLAAVETYRSEMDTIGRFISERCLVAPSLYASAKDLYAAYVEWSGENGEAAATQTTFGTSLNERGFEGSRGRKGRAWIGLALRPSGVETPDVDGLDGLAGLPGNFSTRAHIASFRDNPSHPTPVNKCDVDHTFCSRCGEPCEPGKFVCPACLDAEAVPS